jgi:hypothetical protein
MKARRNVVFAILIKDVVANIAMYPVSYTHFIIEFYYFKFKSRDVKQTVMIDKIVESLHMYVIGVRRRTQ